LAVSGILKALIAPLIAVCILLLLGQAFLFVGWRRRARAERIAPLMMAAGTMLLIVLSMPVVATTLARSLEHTYREPQDDALERLDAIVILSGGYRPGDSPEYDELTAATAARVACGARTWKRSSARWLVLSGRSHRIDGGREGNLMQALALDLGVPSDRILRESVSRTTFEHPDEVLKLPQVRATDTLGVATSAWHMRRAMAQFRRAFQTVVPIPCDFRGRASPGTLAYLPQAHALRLSTTFFHEYASEVWYRLGLASLSKP